MSQNKPEEKKEGDKKPDNKLVKIQNDMSDQVLQRVSELEKDGGLNFPNDYSVANALKSAWLAIQQTKDRNGKPALEVCEKSSIANCLLDMVIQALSPAKKQCYFIVYGNQLTLMRSYFGTIAVTKRLNGVQDVFPQIIFEDDTFEYTINVETGLIKILKHEQKLENIDLTKVRAAYATVIRNNGLPNYTVIMTKKQISDAWEQGATKGQSPAHKKFNDEMSKKTVINRACKSFFNVSNDSDILIDAINRTTENEYLPETTYEEEIDDEIQQNANKEVVDVEVEDAEPVEGEVVDETTAESQGKLKGPGF